jgi:GMP synthase-like glutamine amidotransferase
MLSGKGKNRKSDGRIFKSFPVIHYSVNPDARSIHLFFESGRTIHSFIFHYDEVCTLPQEKATIIARSKECDILAFKVKDRPVWGTQPHFEMGIVQSLRYIDNVKGDQVPDRQIFFSAAQHMPKDSGWVIPLMKAFHETHPI